MSRRRSDSNSTLGPFSFSPCRSRTSAPPFRALALAAALLALQVPTAGAKAIRGPCPAGMVELGTKCGTPVITEIHSFDALGNAYTIQSDGVGTYSHDADGVRSYLLEDGNNGKKHDWFLDVRGSATRRIAENVYAADRVTADDFAGDYYADEASNLPASGASLGQMNVQCTFVSNDMLEIQPGLPVTCPFINAFLYNGADFWGLNAHKSFYQSPQNITDVQITCLSYNSFDSRGCDAWEISPITDLALGADPRLLDPVTGQMQAVGHLVHTIALSRNRTTKESNGNFKMRFSIHIVRPNPAQ